MNRGICFCVVGALIFMLVVPVSAVAPDNLLTTIDKDAGLIDNSITSLVSDSQNDLLYVGTPSGMTVYDTVEQAFVFNETYSNEQTDIIDICEAYNGGGAYILCANQSHPIRQYQEASNFTTPVNASFPDGTILTCTSHSQENLLYIGTYGQGIFEYDLDTLILTQYNVSHDDIQSTSNNIVTELATGKIIGSNDWLFIGTSNGVWVFDIRTKSFIEFGTIESLGYLVQSIYFDNAFKDLYVGRQQGLFIYSMTENNATLEATVSKAYDHGDLASENILSLNMDVASRQLYIGTSYNLVKYDLSESTRVVMSSFGAELGFSQLSDQVINAIAIDDINDILYIGMQEGGIAIFEIVYDPGVIEFTLEVIGLIGLGGLLSLLVFLYTKGKSS